jgi:hypothetical protein
VTGSERGQTVTQVDTVEIGRGGAGRQDTGSGTWRTGIRRAIRIGCRPGPWKRGLVIAALALLLGLFMLLRRSASAVAALLLPVMGVKPPDQSRASRSPAGSRTSRSG